jgi:hypothetical protein
MTPDSIPALFAAAHAALARLSQKKQPEARRTLRQLEAKVAAMDERTTLRKEKK